MKRKVSILALGDEGQSSLSREKGEGLGPRGWSRPGGVAWWSRVSMRAANIWGRGGGGCQGTTADGEESKSDRERDGAGGGKTLEIQQMEAKTWTAVLLLVLRSFMCRQAFLFRALSPSHKVGAYSCTLQSPG